MKKFSPAERELINTNLKLIQNENKRLTEAILSLKGDVSKEVFECFEQYQNYTTTLESIMAILWDRVMIYEQE